jgi:hypothetical protein
MARELKIDRAMYVVDDSNQNVLVLATQRTVAGLAAARQRPEQTSDRGLQAHPAQW